MNAVKDEYNSIKLILEIRNMQQKDLIIGKTSKQSISRYILRKREIPDWLKNEWQKNEYLNINKEYFVDKKGFCRILTEEEKIELETKIIENNYLGAEEIFQDEISLLEREQNLKIDIRKLQRNIRGDINSLNELVESTDELINGIETNLAFYKSVLELHKNSILSNVEWHEIFRAIKGLKDSSNESLLNNDDSLAGDIYRAILTRRKETEEFLKLFDYENLKEKE